MKTATLTIAPDDDEWRTERQSTASLRMTDGVLIYPVSNALRDFSMARNQALEYAHRQGYNWAVLLDTDEELHSIYQGGEDHEALKRMLQFSHDVDVFMVGQLDGTYAKERIFRLPARGHYVGPTHEAFILDDGGRRETATWLWFSEAPKTPEQYRAKAERDLQILEAYTKAHPRDPRWWYYLGDSRAGLGEEGAAIPAFLNCWQLDGWDEESAWAAYRAASIYSGRGHHDDALRWCLKGLERRADYPELYWLAGHASYYLGRYTNAVGFANAAIGVTLADTPERAGFSYPPAHYELPHDVLYWAWRALGDETAAQDAKKAGDLELATRLEKMRAHARAD